MINNNYLMIKELRDLRRQVASEQVELKEAISNVNSLQQKLELIRSRRGRPNGCSEARFNLLSNLSDLRRIIKVSLSFLTYLVFVFV